MSIADLIWGKSAARKRMALACDAWALLPWHIRDALEKVPIRVLDKPGKKEMALGMPPTISGCFVELPGGDAAREDEDDTATPPRPGVIYLFLDNISPCDAEGVAGVLLHEAVHALGLDDNQAEALGL